MTEPRATALQLCPFTDHLEAGLRARFRVIRWFELDAEAQAAWLAAEAHSVRAVVTGGHIGCSNALMVALPALRIVTVHGVGLDKIDLPFATGRGVRITTTPGVLTDDVADLAVGLLISLLREIPRGDAFVRSGQWLDADRPPARKVTGRHFGIVGLGQIGAAIAARLAPFGRVSWHGPRDKPSAHAWQPDLLQLARDCSVLVVACPANAATRHLIGAPVLEALGPAGVLVNIARGAVVDEQALVAALASNGIGGAALDVFEDEPRVPQALRDDPRVVLTPHVGSSTVETRVAMAELVLANLDACMAGQPLPTARN